MFTHLDIQTITPATIDKEWDNFLAGQLYGHYTQSSMWGQLKAHFGWQVHRILVKENEAILGGVQILTRRLPIWGKVGYISKGPIARQDDPKVMAEIFNKLELLAREDAIMLLSIQPPFEGSSVQPLLTTHHFEPSKYYVIPPATVVIDLSPTEEDILAKMKRTTRQNIRAAQTRGVEIVEGNEAHLPAFCQLKRLTESRSDFVHYNQDYYSEAWRQFTPQGNMKLWLASYRDELIAGLMAIYFGNWVVYAWAGSSGAYTDKRPNDLLFWHAMKWAKEHGFRYADLGGISPIVADAINQNQEPPECKEKGIARYKLGFGPMQTFPASYDNIYILRPKWLVRKAISFVWDNNRKYVSKLIRVGSG